MSTHTRSQQPIAPDLFTWPSAEPHLLGGACDACGAVTFPRQFGCPRCGAVDMSSRELPRRGTLVSWTTQEFLPPDSASGETRETFKPFAVGLVQLGDDVRVEARLTEHDFANLQFGMAVELAIVPFRIDDSGTEHLMFAFGPCEEN